MARMGRFHDGLMLLGIAMALLGGMALAMAAGMFVGSPKEAHAQVSPGHLVFELCKVWETQGATGATQTFYFDVSDISQTVENIPITGVVEGSEARCIFLEAAPGAVLITEDDPGPAFLPPQWLSDNEEVRSVGTAAFTLTPGGCLPLFTTVVLEELVSPVGPSTPVCTITFYNSDTKEPAPLANFQLCKEWTSNGVLSGTRDFVFNVSDTAQSRQVTVANVTEGGPPVCVNVTAPTGTIEVSEVVPIGYDTPEWFMNDVFAEATSGTFAFGLLSEVCGRTTTDQLVQAVVQVPSCTITVVNEDNDTATVTATPTFVVCPRCNTPAVPTSTPTPPPSNTATPPPATATQPSLPTATPTTGTGSGTGGLTDAQRTQTAVAAARTAAAQSTPLPPRTGAAGTGPGGSGGVNVALFAMGLLVLSAGLGVIAVRSRR